jgi:hypothetical protein
MEEKLLLNGLNQMIVHLLILKVQILRTKKRRYEARKEGNEI